MDTIGQKSVEISEGVKAIPEKPLRKPALVWSESALSSEYWALCLSVVYFLALTPFTPELASAENVANIFSNLLPLLVVATGQALVMISGGIDLSATSVIALSSVTGAMVMSSDQGMLANSPMATPAGLLAMLLVGAGVGLLNGAAVTKFRMPPFIVTLTTMMFFSGLAIWLTKSKSIYNLPASFIALGKGSIFFIPYALIVTALLMVCAHVMLSKSLLGRWLYAVGNNVKAASVSGAPVDRIVILAYAGSGMCAAVASMLYTGRLETGSPVMGQRVLLDVIGAAVIGGVSLFGGKGKIPWVIWGALFITLIDNSLNLQGRSHFAIMMAKGGVILLAALIDVVRVRMLGGR